MLGTTLPVQDDLAGLKSNFLACLNHEIRTPLNGILGLTEVLLEDELKDEQRECAQSIRSCAESLFAVLHATLEYSALSAGTAVLDESEFRIEELFQAVIAEYGPKADAKGLTLRFQSQNSLPETAIGDAIHIRQVFCCLLDNAIKFTPTGKVEVLIQGGEELNQDRFELQVQVRDSGIGIAQDRQEAIFEAFHQLDTGLARQFAGLGLGLALAQKMVQLLGGSMSIESAPGDGSTFTFIVPVLSATQKRKGPGGPQTNQELGEVSQPPELRFARVPQKRKGPGGPQTNSEVSQPPELRFARVPQKQSPTLECRNVMAAGVVSGSFPFPRVLVVEDNQVAQRIVTRTLEKKNYKVVSAFSGLDAIVQVKSGVFDLILMDLQMPGMDGIEAASAIRQLENGKNIPVVAFTANTTAEYRAMCRKAGFNGFLAKPVNTNDLLSTVEQFCGKPVSLAS